MKTIYLRTVALALATSIGAASCLSPVGDDEANNEGVLPPDLEKAGSLSMRGELRLDEPVLGEFTKNYQLDGYEISVAQDATVRVEVTQAGSKRGLDTVMFVYGPKVSGAYPAEPLLIDNDSGWGKLSRVTAQVPTSGTYLVAIGTKKVTGATARGKYRVLATCRSGDATACAWAPPVTVIPLGACPQALQTPIAACVENWQADGYEGSVLDLVDQCSDAEILAPAYDADCDGGEAPAWCLGSLEATYATYAAPCARDVKQTLLDATCALGTTYNELKNTPHMVQLHERVITSPSGFSTIEKNQIVSAMHASSHTDVTTVAEALAAADSGEIIRIIWWDVSNRQTYVSYEYGAGDNSYGRVFFYGSATAVATINDGDLYDCTTYVGPEGRACTATYDCAAGTQCVGIAEPTGFGVCIANGADNSPQEGASCSATAYCNFTSGLTCAGLSRGSEGMCLPAWMRRAVSGRFDTPIPDNNAAGATAQLVMSGIATVDMDVWVHLEITHSRRSDLKVYLRNPAGTEALVIAPTDAGEAIWIDTAVLGFSGDESVNGVWTIRVVDNKSSRTGTIHAATLTVGSRWD